MTDCGPSHQPLAQDSGGNDVQEKDPPMMKRSCVTLLGELGNQQEISIISAKTKKTAEKGRQPQGRRRKGKLTQAPKARDPEMASMNEKRC
jgi:hypothetical protein